MPLNFLSYSSFERCFKKLDSTQKVIVERILKALLAYYESNCQLSEAQKVESRFFYKQLRKPYYEAGIEGKIRVLIARDKSDCTAVLVGNHDQIKRFLANQ